MKAEAESDGLNELHRAILALNLWEVLRLLNRDGAKLVNQPASNVFDRITPLMLAARIGSPKIVFHLLAAGADGNICDINGKRCEYYANEGPWHLTTEALEMIQKTLNKWWLFLRLTRYIFGTFRSTIMAEEIFKAMEQIRCSNNST